MTGARGSTTSPLVSVVIPVFNRAALISRALDSVANQTFDDYEIIVVDDGSTDGTVDSIQSWGADRLRLIASPLNRGAAAARNIGVSAALGHWIAFLDSDDYWQPEKLARQLSALDGASAQFMACATGYHLWDGGRKTTVQFQMSPAQFRTEIRFGCSISPGSTLLVARQAFQAVGGFDESLRRLEDWDWLLRFVDHGDIIFVPEPLAHVRRSQAEVVYGDRDPVLLALQHIAARHLPRFQKMGIIARRQFQSSILIEMAARTYRMNRPIMTIRYVLTSLAIYPFRNRSFFNMLWRSVTKLWTTAAAVWNLGLTG
jgi:glycosyltransferase involved in cell wall biosynthesis